MEKDNLVQKITSWREKYNKLEEQQKSRISELEFEVQESQAKLANERMRMNELEGEAINIKANEKAMTNFKTLQKNSIMQNKQLQNDLDAHKEQLGNRQSEYERLIEENNKFKQNFALNQDGIKKY